MSRQHQQRSSHEDYSSPSPEDRNSIVQPDQMSVRELRQWLSRFGEQNKTHFERNQIQSAKPMNVRRKIQQLEVGLVSSSASSSVASSIDDTSPGSPATAVQSDVADDNKKYECVAAPQPVFRSFEDDNNKEPPTMSVSNNRDIGNETHNPRASSSRPDYRIVSIRKLLDSPPRYDAAPPQPCCDDELADIFPGSTCLWQPRIHSFVLEEERTVQSFDDGMTQTSATEEESPGDESSLLEEASCSFSDPGCHCANNYSDEPRAVKKWGFRSKLPLLLCKSVKEERCGFTDVLLENQPSTYHTVSPPREAVAPESAVNDDMRPTTYVAPQTIVQDDAFSQSTWNELASSCDMASMGDVFSQEVHFMNHSDETRVNHVVPREAQRTTQPGNDSVVRAAVQQFGGGGRPNAVQRRREALERKFAQDKPFNFSKKVQWHVRNGMYRRKVTLNVHK